MRRTRIPVLLALLVTSLALSACGAAPLAVVMRNDSDTAMPPTALVSAAGTTTVPTVPAGGSVKVHPALPPSESDLRLVAPGEQSYMLVSYMEGNPSGKLTVVITSHSGGILSGRIIDRVGSVFREADRPLRDMSHP